MTIAQSAAMSTRTADWLQMFREVRRAGLCQATRARARRALFATHMPPRHAASGTAMHHAL